MAVVSVSLAFDQRRPLTLARSLDRRGYSGAHSEYILSIHHLTGYAVGDGTVGCVGLFGGRLPGHRHGVEIVLDDVNHRQVPDTCHVERFVEVAGIGCALAEEAKDNTVFASLFDGQPCAGGDGDVARHDAGSAQITL